jgi:hypothetical protein
MTDFWQSLRAPPASSLIIPPSAHRRTLDCRLEVFGQSPAIPQSQPSLHQPTIWPRLRDACGRLGLLLSPNSPRLRSLAAAGRRLRSAHFPSLPRVGHHHPQLTAVAQCGADSLRMRIALDLLTSSHRRGPQVHQGPRMDRPQRRQDLGRDWYLVLRRRRIG